MNFSFFSSGVKPSNSESFAYLDNEEGPEENHYRFSRTQKFLYRLACVTPPALREPIADAFLGRVNAPGPATEHVFQFALGKQLAGDELRKTTNVAKAADKFYERQHAGFRTLLLPICFLDARGRASCG
jgi:hypothetical protein